MQANQPLLSIAIPTYNRAAFLRELLDNLKPDLLHQSCVELIISDNASPDNTQQVVSDFRHAGLEIVYLRNEENIGSDKNFIQCFKVSRGKYVWVLGDDDLLMPKTISKLLRLLADRGESDDYDLIYLSSIGFSGKFVQPSVEQLKDKLGRFAEIVIDGEYFLEKVNGLIGLISVNIINKNRIEQRGYPPLEALAATNLLQLGWIFPLVKRRMRVLYVWERVVAYRTLNSGGWAILDVFGIALDRISRQYFKDEPLLARALMNGVIRYWMFESVMAARLGMEPGKELGSSADKLAPVFGSNWRYWLFVHPIASLPLWAAKMVFYPLRVVNRFTRAMQAILRHVLHSRANISAGSILDGNEG